MARSKGEAPAGKSGAEKALQKKKIGFLGSGNMAEALIKGILYTGLAKADNIIAMDVSQERLKYISETCGVKTTDSAKDMASQSDVIFVATKPNNVEEALKSTADSIDPKKLVISIAAGIKTSFIESILKEGVPVIRVMPNTPALVLSGMTALSAGSFTKEEHIQIADSIFSSVGEVVVVDEDLIDAVTALSGSGPAYVFLIIEAMAEGGMNAGLPKDIALKLATHTALGAAKMIIETERHPGELRDMVTSPGGTTIEALSVLKNEKVREAFIKAVEAAFVRAKELGEES